MFCSKCGNLLEDTAKFCDKCGTPTGSAPASGSVVAEKKPDTEVLLHIKPKYKMIYFWWSAFLAMAFILIIAILIAVFTSDFTCVWGGLTWCAIIAVCKAISLLFKKRQIKCMEYDFYRTKVCYKDSFLNKAEKEVKYKHIREVILTRSISDRIFGFGKIMLYTNAETYGNGILIPFLDDSESVYKKVKELLDE